MKKLIKYLKNNPNVFISDIDSLLQNLKFEFFEEANDETYNKLMLAFREVLKHNLAVLNKEKWKNNSLRENLNKLYECATDNLKNFIESEIKITENQEQTESIDINRYFFNLINCQNEEEIIAALPRTEDYDYTDKIYAILFQIKKEIKTYKVILKDCPEEEKQNYQKEIENLNKILEYIINYQKNSTIEEKNISNSVNIYLLTRSIGDSTSLIEEDLKEILTSENIRDFKKLMDDFISGKFIEKASNKTNGHGFNSNHSKLQKLQEVKHNQARITYFNLGQGNYILIKAFIKKDKSSTVTIKNLINNYEVFKNQSDLIREKINDPEYNVEQEIYLEKVLKLLYRKEEND